MTTEVKNVENKTQIVEQEVLAYLNKTSKHLFITEDKFFFKVVTIKINDVWYYMTLKFNGEKCHTYISGVGISEREINQNIQYYGGSLWGNMEWVGKYRARSVKTTLFSEYNKTTSIKYFKAMKAKIAEVVTYVESNYNQHNDGDIRNGVSKILEGMKPLIIDKEE